MIRLAREDDTPAIIQGMLALKPLTGWALYDRPGYDESSLTYFLYKRMADPRSVLYVWDVGTSISAFCGGSLDRFYLPPHMPLVFEWGWWGPPREAVQCYQAVARWGKRHGAELIGHVKARPGMQANAIHEHIVWKVIR